MTKSELTKTSKFLLYLAAANDLLTPALNIYELRKRTLFGSPGSFNSTVYKFYKKGWIKVVNKNSERFIKLTSQGELEVLMIKAHMPARQEWDGKWRVFAFDIPKESGNKRDLLRKLLKDNNFIELQASVYISPYPINREAIEYLSQSKLTAYIRIMKVEEIDNDKDLRKKFNLK